ncbi:MAG: Trk system potassium transporter TrkA, partial [Rickettsiales bacterium]|nr:Trk system potassium transporter TrkA [Rickettsiales bacterium]
MKIIVCGAGQVGTSIARQLSYEDNDVTVIDQSVDRIRKITDSIDVNSVVGFASHPPVLEEAGAQYADMIIAVTISDEVNMVICQVAHSLFRLPTKIARVRHQFYLHEKWKDLYREDHLPIDVIISPELEVSRAVNHRLHVPGAIGTIPYAEGRVKVVAVRCEHDSPLANLLTFKIKELAKSIGISILGIVRDQNFIFPRDKEPLLVGDEVYFVADHRKIEEAMILFGHEEKEARRIIIIGGGNIGLYLAEQLEEEDSDLRVRIIELNQKRAQFVAQQLEYTSVINGSALEQEILEEANVSSAETVISVSNDDEVNILSALLAKRFGCQRAISLINSRSYAPLISSL